MVSKDVRKKLFAAFLLSSTAISSPAISEEIKPDQDALDGALKSSLSIFSNVFNIFTSDDSEERVDNAKSLWGNFTDLTQSASDIALDSQGDQTAKDAKADAVSMASDLVRDHILPNSINRGDIGDTDVFVADTAEALVSIIEQDLIKEDNAFIDDPSVLVDDMVWMYSKDLEMFGVDFVELESQGNGTLAYSLAKAIDQEISRISEPRWKQKKQEKHTCLEKIADLKLPPQKVTELVTDANKFKALCPNGFN